MYSNYVLSKNPSFKMTKEDFNQLVNSLTETPEEGSRPVKVGLTIRTATNNLVATKTLKEHEVVFIHDLDPTLGKGYFNIINNLQKFLTETFGELTLDIIKKTVLMPVGAFEDEGDLIIYCVLVIQDEQLETFSTNDSIKFIPIEENSLKNLDNRSIIILPTLTVVKK